MSKLKAYADLAAEALQNKLNELRSNLSKIQSTEDDDAMFLSNDVIKIKDIKSLDCTSLSTTLQHNLISTDSIKRVNQEKALPKCLPFEPGFEKLQQIPTKMSVRQTKKLKQLAKSKTKGKGWFDMSVQEMTEEKLNDLKIIQMRGVLDPKRFYKNTDIRPGVLPKFFQTGSVVETTADFYSSRIPKRQRKKTLVEELLNDAEFKRYKKRKYNEIAAKTNRYTKKKKRVHSKQ